MIATLTHPVPRAGQSAWTRRLARDLFPGKATPFGWSVLRGPAEASLRAAGLAMSAEPGEQNLWRLGEDWTVYLDAAAVEAMDAAGGGPAWLGTKPTAARISFLGRLQSGSANRRRQSQLAALPTSTTALRAQVWTWLGRVRALGWAQADLLQVMEELEPRATAVLTSYFVARAGLNAAAATLEDFAGGQVSRCTFLYAGLSGLPTVEAAYALPAIAQGGPDPDRTRGALERFGHRGPGEVRADASRWLDSPGLLSRLPAQIGWPAERATRLREEAEGELRQGNPKHWSQTEAQLRTVRGLVKAVDEAWDAVVMVMAAAQGWLAAAGREAANDRLIERPQDALYLELEELKQVATGEWHGGRSDEVRDRVDRRRAGLASAAAEPIETDAVVCASPGQASGPAYCGSPSHVAAPPGSVWLAESADSGAAPFWQSAAAIVTAAPDTWSPGMIAVRALGMPAVAGAASTVAQAESGRTMTVDSGAGSARVAPVV